MKIIQLISDFVTAPGSGGIIIAGVMVVASITYYYLTRWIINGNEEEHVHEAIEIPMPEVSTN